MFKRVLLGVLLAISFFAVFFNPIKVTKAIGCTLQPMWTWTDGKDYVTPPGTANVGDTVQTKTKFLNCNGLDAYFVFIKPSGAQQQIGLRRIDSDSMDQTASLKFDTVGQYYYKVVAQGSAGTYQSYSDKANAISASSNTCNVTLNFNVVPTSVDSLSQTINLKAVIGQTYDACGMTNLTIEFFSNGRSMGKQNLNLSGRQLGKEIGTQTTAGALNYQSATNIAFTAKVTGNACEPVVYGGMGAPPPPSCKEINLISTPVNVGVMQAPASITKYGCVNNACVQDTNGNYNSYELCHAACVAGTGGGAGSGSSTTSPGGGSTTTKYTFNLPNPIGVENFQDLVNIIGRWIFNLAIPIAVIIIIYAGVLMLTAGGNPTTFKKGAEALKYALIGLAVVLIGKGFVTLIQSILSLRNP